MGSVKNKPVEFKTRLLIGAAHNVLFWSTDVYFKHNIKINIYIWAIITNKQ